MFSARFLRDAALVVVPVIAIMAVLPLLYSNHLLLFNFVVFLTLAQGVNILYGFTGYLAFGYVGLVGAGAYGLSIAGLHLQAPPLASCVAAGRGARALQLL